MNYIIKLSFVLLFVFNLVGCSSRQPIGMINVKINLNKEIYKEIVSKDGISSFQTMIVLSLGKTEGGIIYDSGSGINIPITEEIKIMGLNADNMLEKSFSMDLKWGDNDFEIPILYSKNVVYISGHGPSGKINKYIGKIDYNDSSNKYEINIIKK